MAIVQNLNELEDGRFRRSFGLKVLESALSFQCGVEARYGQPDRHALAPGAVSSPDRTKNWFDPTQPSAPENTDTWERHCHG